MAYSGVINDVRICVNLSIPQRVPIFALGEQFNVRMHGITYAEYTYEVATIQPVQSYPYN